MFFAKKPHFLKKLIQKKIQNNFIVNNNNKIIDKFAGPC